MKIKKLCNAFATDAAAGNRGLGIFGIPINEEIDTYKKKSRGLWVGGKLIVDNGKVMFRRNLTVKKIHPTGNDLEIDLKRVTKIWWQFGWISGIINIQINEQLVKLRCFGAKRVVERLNAFIHS